MLFSSAIAGLLHAYEALLKLLRVFFLLSREAPRVKLSVGWLEMHACMHAFGAAAVAAAAGAEQL